MNKNKNGITLIALVITIIVLLILAGITISLVTGQNGVLTRAENASNVHSIAVAKEQAQMKAAGYISEYMEKVYVDNDSTVGSMTTGEYVLSQINGEEDGDYRYSVSGSTITVTSKTTGETLASGTIDDNGEIGWSDNVASGENNGGGTSSNILNNPNAKPVLDITALDYGQYVDLGTNILPKTGDTITQKLQGDEQPLADWRVFLKIDDDTYYGHGTNQGVWLILADYIPKESVPNSYLKPLRTSSSDYDYSVGTNQNFTSSLFNSLDCKLNELLAGSSVQGVSGVNAYGAPTLKEWVKSWNDNARYPQLEVGYKRIPYLQGTSSGNAVIGAYQDSARTQANVDGNAITYLNIGNANNSMDYSDTLYFPHNEVISHCEGYWISSNTFADPNHYLYISHNGSISGAYFKSDTKACRPIVFIPSDLYFDTSSDVWTVLH